MSETKFAGGAPSTQRAAITRGPSLVVAGLFAGIGGIELGLHTAGHRSVLLCEIEPTAQAVLRKHFPGVELVTDVRRLEALPKVDLVAAGFPCQDLSQAGRTNGIGGQQSSLVGQVFRLLDEADRAGNNPTWLLFENVPFMLHLDRGEAMRYLTHELGQRGFQWAYRVVNTRSFGLPQRRQRVLLLASKSEDPREVLYVGNEAEPKDPDYRTVANGFYWTEGLRGLGWAVDAVPTLKGGSTIGIPSPPGIWMPSGEIVTLDIRDAERLQGFEADWTAQTEALETGRKAPRWKLVGNAVSVPVSKWLGKRLLDPRPYDNTGDTELRPGAPWPKAAWGRNGNAFKAERLTTWAMREKYQHLREFLRYPTSPLSLKAAMGFRERTRASSLHFVEGFLPAIDCHIATLRHRRASPPSEDVA